MIMNSGATQRRQHEPVHAPGMRNASPAESRAPRRCCPRPRLHPVHFTVEARTSRLAWQSPQRSAPPYRGEVVSSSPDSPSSDCLPIDPHATARWSLCMQLPHLVALRSGAAPDRWLTVMHELPYTLTSAVPLRAHQRELLTLMRTWSNGPTAVCRLAPCVGSPSTRQYQRVLTTHETFALSTAASGTNPRAIAAQRCTQSSRRPTVKTTRLVTWHEQWKP